VSADPRFLLATRSEHKLREAREILSEARARIVSLVEVGLPETPEEAHLEPFDTFAQNALSKARHFHTLSGLPTIADDSGLCVDALGGRPGVRTKRFAPDRMAAEWGRDEANNRYLLERMTGVLERERGAHYHCAIALVEDDGHAIFEGRVSGRIAHEPRGSGGFGYDPLFILPERGLTYAELPPEVKRATSHRARALIELQRWLRTRSPGGADTDSERLR
jgi:XTP/dITP diphosphohydrolase